MTEQIALDDLDLTQAKGMEGRRRPAISEAETSPCTCPEMCLRDHENE